MPKKERKKSTGNIPSSANLTKITKPTQVEKHRIIFLGDVHNTGNSISNNMKRAKLRSINKLRKSRVTLLEVTDESDNGGHIGKTEYVSEIGFLTAGKPADSSQDRQFLMDLCAKSISIIGFDVEGKFDSLRRHKAQLERIKKAISKDMGKVESARDYVVVIGEAHLEALPIEGWVPHHQSIEEVPGIMAKAEVFCYSFIEGEDGQQEELNYDDVPD